jgi:phosphoribosylformylglycinamidine cyclo-ligase
MHRTFNCGIGMVAIVPPEHEAAALALLQTRDEQATRIGSVREGTAGVTFR